MSARTSETPAEHKPDDAAVALVADAVRGDRRAMRQLVHELTPVLQSVIVRRLLRCRAPTSEMARQEVADLMQDTFVALFENDRRVLRQWEPSRGRTLRSFVGLVAEREVYSKLRSRTRSPFTELAHDDEALASMGLDARPAAPGPEEGLATRRLLEAVLDRVRDRLGERGVALFHLLVVDERSAEEVGEITGMTADAIYAWHGRFRRLARGLAIELALDSAASDSGSAARRNKGEEP